jgi:hypothetical protein
MTNEVRPLTSLEHKRGWFALACGCHAYIWRASILADLPPDAIELCDKGGEPIWGVKVSALEATSHD